MWSLIHISFKNHAKSVEIRSLPSEKTLKLVLKKKLKHPLNRQQKKPWKNPFVATKKKTEIPSHQAMRWPCAWSSPSQALSRARHRSPVLLLPWCLNVSKWVHKNVKSLMGKPNSYHSFQLIAIMSMLIWGDLFLWENDPGKISTVQYCNCSKIERERIFIYNIILYLYIYIYIYGF